MRFDDHGISRHKGGGNFSGSKGQWVVPRDKRYDDAVGYPKDEDLFSDIVRTQRVAFYTAGPLSVVLELERRPHYFSAGSGKRLSLFCHDGISKRIYALTQKFDDVQEVRRTPDGRHLCPCFLRAAGCVQRLLCLWVSDGWDLRNDLTAARVVHRHHSCASRMYPLSVYKTTQIHAITTEKAAFRAERLYKTFLHKDAIWIVRGVCAKRCASVISGSFK